MPRDESASTLFRLDSGAYHAGDLIWASWDSDGYLYPAIVIDIVDTQYIHVVYLDGEDGPIGVNEAFITKIAPGTTVSVNFKGQGAFFLGTVATVIGMALEIDYTDGDNGFATIAQCRLPMSGGGGA